MGNGGMLIEKNPYAEASFEDDKIIKPEIDFKDHTLIDNSDLEMILFYPRLNERLYLCYKYGKNVDPLKDFVFDRNIPLDYEVYIKLYADKMTEEEWKKLPS